MANAVLPATKKAALDAILATGTAKAYLIDTASYTYSSAHDFLADIPGGARVGSAVSLTNITTTDGVFDADDVSFTGLSGAPTIEAVAICVDTGVEATSRFLCYIDTATGLPASAGASQVNVAWDGGANKIFKL
jgi:hypothetical protein